MTMFNERGHFFLICLQAFSNLQKDSKSYWESH